MQDLSPPLLLEPEREEVLANKVPVRILVAISAWAKSIVKQEATTVHCQNVVDLQMINQVKVSYIRVHDSKQEQQYKYI